jgi:hypothetical protein
MTKSLDELWKELAPAASGAVFRRVNELHPLDLYAGIEPDGSKVLLLVCDSEPPAAKRRYNAFDVTVHCRHDGRWALSIRLKRPELGRLFGALCQDLVDGSMIDCQPADGPTYVSDRIARWERLLSRDRSGLLDEAALRGLIGELVFLSRCAIPAKGRRTAVEAWAGPLQADQDFRFSDRLVEIKCAGAGSLCVTISSAEQLDAHGTDLFLCCVSVESASETVPDAFSLTGLVGSIRATLADDADAIAMFDERLALAGYTENPEYDGRYFLVSGIRYYTVADEFPRLRRSRIPAAVRALNFDLDLAVCSDWQRTSCFD